MYYNNTQTCLNRWKMNIIICLFLSPDRTWHKVKWPEGWIIVEGGSDPS